MLHDNLSCKKSIIRDLVSLMESIVNDNLKWYSLIIQTVLNMYQRLE